MSVKQKMNPYKRSEVFEAELRLHRASSLWSLHQRLLQAFKEKMANVETVAKLEAENEELDREIRLLQFQLQMSKKNEMLKKGTDYTMRDVLARDAGPHLEQLRATIESCLEL
jgi:hypothetical protein